MPTTLEDLSRLLDSNPGPTELARQADIMAAGIHDAKDRIANLEHASLEAQHRLTILEDRLAKHDTLAAGYAKDRDDFRKRVTDVEKLPTDTAKQVADLTARLRAVEGAVGSKNFQATPAPKPDLSGAKASLSPAPPTPGVMAGIFGPGKPGAPGKPAAPEHAPA